MLPTIQQPPSPLDARAHISPWAWQLAIKLNAALCNPGRGALRVLERRRCQVCNNILPVDFRGHTYQESQRLTAVCPCTGALAADLVISHPTNVCLDDHCRHESYGQPCCAHAPAPAMAGAWVGGRSPTVMFLLYMVVGFSATLACIMLLLTIYYISW